MVGAVELEPETSEVAMDRRTELEVMLPVNGSVGAKAERVVLSMVEGVVLDEVGLVELLQERARREEVLVKALRNLTVVMVRERRLRNAEIVQREVAVSGGFWRRLFGL
jgi:hypothetical protein